MSDTVMASLIVSLICVPPILSGLMVLLFVCKEEYADRKSKGAWLQRMAERERDGDNHS